MMKNTEPVNATFPDTPIQRHDPRNRRIDEMTAAGLVRNLKRFHVMQQVATHKAARRRFVGNANMSNSLSM
jgi:hypothetical protein